MLRICRFIKRGPGAILGMVLLVVVGIAACTWYRVNVVWERITPEQAAQLLSVSVEDVLASIQSGELKARRIGAAYRIARSALDEFLRG